MVATRRTAQPGPADELASDPDIMLKKPPVRKTTAKGTVTSKTTTAAKGRTTRGKKAEPEDEEVEIAEDVQAAKPVKTARKAAGRRKQDADANVTPVVVEAPAPVKVTRATKTGSVRGRKAVSTVEEEPVAPAVGDVKPPRTAKAGTLRGRKAATAIQEEPEPAVAEELKPTKAAKGGSLRGKKAAAALTEAPALPAPEQKPTRGTRATATKTQPLSPKKITQVSKPNTRTARNATQKSAAKAAPGKAPSKGRGTMRKRTVSDENAEVPNLQPAIDEDEDVLLLSSTPVQTRSAPHKNGKQEKADSEMSMSSRPTTPNDSTLQSVSQSEVDKEDEVVEEQSIDDMGDEEETADANASEDELCGPKTPMKRASPGSEARYLSSVQRTIRKYEDQRRDKTPAQRFAVLGSQRGTPQTQKPYCKPMPPSSEVRPMTVARGTDRAFVFRDLSEGTPALPEVESEAEIDEELSFIPDDDIIPLDNDIHNDVDQGNVDMFVGGTSATSPARLQLQSPPTSASEVAEDDDTDEEVEEVIMTHNYDAGEFVAPAEIERDPEETMLAEDAEVSEDDEDVQPGESFETEDTVIITRAQPVEDEVMQDMTATDSEVDDDSVIVHDLTEETEDDEPVYAEPTRQEATITVNFDNLFNGARAASHANEPEMMADADHPQAVEVEMESDTVAGAEMDGEPEPVLTELPSRRETLNFNEFIDVAALAEPIEALRLSSMHHVEDGEASEILEPDSTLGMPAPAEVAKEDFAVVEHDQEMATVEPMQPVPVQNDDKPTEQAVADYGDLPHYARPTIAFDARRKSLPVLSHRTPIKTGTRPNTSDGVSMPRIANPFTDAWWSRSRAASTTTTPVKARPSTAYGMLNVNSPAKTPLATPKDRFPRLAPRQNYEEYARTVAAPARFQTPPEKPLKRRETFHKAAAGRTIASTPKPEQPVLPTPQAVETAATTPSERYPGLRPRHNYEEHARTVAAPVRFRTPAEQPGKRRETFHKAATGRINGPSLEPIESESFTLQAPETPVTTPGERYPRLRPRQDYSEHATTVAAPVRFHTPVKTPLKRPATAKKPESLRKAALKANTPTASHSPMKTPLKAAAMTPGQEPLTPHPAAPLRGVLALVEVFTLEGASASAPFVALLHRLGAKSTKAWSDRVTHVIFKDGSPTTLQRVRLHNKDVEEKGSGAIIHCVNSRWITDCDIEGTRMDESDEVYAVDVAEIPRGGKRRRKSMEPSALLNLGGNIVRDRKSSVGRTSSFGRSPLKFDVDSPVKKAEEGVAEFTPIRDSRVVGKENSGDEASSPVTPAWIAAPGQLVQQTAPMNRVRKLDLPAKQGAKSRRLTFWNGGT
jgi:hypothetical protein